MRNELLEEFAGFTELDSVSFGERRMADLLKKKLKALGFETEEDDAGSHYGGNAGNVYGFLKGSLSGEPVLFSAHMDTVEPGIGKKAVFQEDGRITSDGTTVLGADDAAGLTEILGGIRRVLSSGKPHRDIEVLFPIAEEVYTKGTRVFDFSKIRSKEAYVLDLSGPVGSAAVQAPSLISFVLTIHGKAAHAGFEPEKGIHAIQIAADAIGSIQMGHVEEDTTVNVGEISGGTGTNIVPERCEVRGEIRSYVHEKALEQMNRMEEIFRTSAGRYGGEAEVTCRIGTYAYETSMGSTVVRRMRAVCKKLGFSFLPKESFGGSDNNVLAAHGIEGIVLACGMEQVHSVQEYTTVQALKETAELLTALACPETEEKIC